MDVPALTAACQDPEIPAGRWCPSPYSERDAAQFVAAGPGALAAGRALDLAIVAGGVGDLLGAVGLVEFAWEQRRAEIGYWVAREARGRGVAARAVRLLSDWALRELGIERIELIACRASGLGGVTGSGSSGRQSAPVRSFGAPGHQSQDARPGSAGRARPHPAQIRSKAQIAQREAQGRTWLCRASRRSVRPMEQRISLVTLGVRDLERARTFYETLGWTTGAEPGADVVFFQTGGAVLALWDRASLADDSGVPDAGGWGGVTLAHNVRSPAEVDTLIEEARAAGAMITHEPGETFWGGYSGAFADPDGHPWEVAHNPRWELLDDGSVVLPD
jgi:uncharacterized protein